CMQLKEYPLTF
nr:immunoglobulin light chain junction region [Macaca mulatta]MOV35050.1 immunoglobulin light chain junction region [Macaca mulatta]